MTITRPSKFRFWRHIATIMATAAATVAVLGPAAAVTRFQKSAYTTIDLKHCTPLHADPHIRSYRCPGLDGQPVYFADGDGRAFVSAGEAPEAARAATQTLKSFNTPFTANSERATVEWRFVIRDNRQVPYAMIVRFFTLNAGATGEVLIVTRISGAESCHVAYIDARANSEAIVLARRIADQRARMFDCRKPATVEGESGLSPM